MWKTCVIVAILAGLVGCDLSPPKSVPPVEQLAVSFTTQPQCTLLHVAQAKGYFADERLDIKPQLHTFGKAALQALLDGKADIATAAETPIMFSILRGEKIYVVANIETSTTNSAIVARRDAGITRPAELKGKRVGFTPGTTSDFFMSSLLTANGLVRSDVVPVGLKPEEMRDALISRRVDAVSTWNYPLTTIIRELGDNATVFFDRDIYTETFNLVVKQEFALKNPDVIQRFLRALTRAETFTHEHPAEAQAIVSQATKTDLELVRSVWNNFGYRLVLDQALLIMLEDETRWAIKNGLTDRTEMPNYLTSIYVDALRAVKPDAIRLKW